MENNYNEWNPNGTEESVQESASGNADQMEDTDSVYSAQNAANDTQNSNYSAQNVANDTQNSNYSTQSSPYGAQNSAYGAQNQNYGAQSSAYSTQNQNYGAQSSAYSTQNQNYGTQNSVYSTQTNGYGSQSRGYGAQGAGYNRQGSSYGSIDYNQQGSPYSQQNAQSTSYGAQNQAQSGMQGNAYGTPNPTQGAAYRPAGSQPKAKKQKKSGGIASLLGKTVAVALVFGLVASLVFSGVNYGLGNALGTNSSSSGDSLVTNTVSTVSTSGEASDLVDVASIVDAVMPGIVAITNISTVTTSSMFGNYSYESQSLGSGIIIAQDADYLYICTNNHVVSGAESLTVQFVDDSTASAEITGTDEADDLAVIQVALSSIESDTLETITIVEVDDSGDLSVGEGTIAIGNSLGYGQSVTTGVISALGRTITVTDSSTGETTVCTNLIQTDAAINSGNSGGALLNSSGAVIGINSAKYSDTGVEGMGYAIPMSDAWSIITAIIAGEDIPQSAYLGISGQSVSTDVASVYGVPEGVLVVEVYEGTAAAEAGIQSGDIITKFESEELTSMDELKTILASYKEGDTVTITVARQSDGYAETDLEVTLGASTSSN